MDQAGVICQQEGIFRVNCMDCLDRTNVVQAAIARAVMELQVQSVRYLESGQKKYGDICVYLCVINLELYF